MLKDDDGRIKFLFAIAHLTVLLTAEDVTTVGYLGKS